MVTSFILPLLTLFSVSSNDVVFVSDGDDQTCLSYNRYIMQADSLFFKGWYAQSSDMFERAFKQKDCIKGNDLYNGACAAAMAGKTDAAFNRLFTRMVKEPDWYSENFANDDDLVRLHADSRWQAFRDSMLTRKDRVERHYDIPLRLKLLQIEKADQNIRQQYMQAFSSVPRNQRLVDSLSHEMQRIDKQNQMTVCDILDHRGFVSRSVVGDVCEVLWLIIQHAPLELEKKYLPVFQKAAERHDLMPMQVAMMEDRIAMFEGRPQKYGTQRREDTNGKMVLWKLLDPAKVDLWRKEKGLPPLTMSDNSLRTLLQQGDSCMRQYNTYEALGFYQQAYDKEDTYETRTKLADCCYRRADYRKTAELLKLIPEDSLSHDAFRQLAYSYQKQGDVDSYIYWAEQLVNRYPHDGEMVAGLTLALVQKNQAWKGLKYGLDYCAYDSNNMLVNRAVADALFLDRQFPEAATCYESLLQQGDSTFNAFYSAGMCYAQIDSLELAYERLSAAFHLSQMQHAGCAYRLGVVCVDTKRYPEGLGYLNLAKELMRPDTTIMKAITLSQGEGYYLTHHYPEAVEAWKEHLTYNPSSVATYYNIANAYAYLLKDREQALEYYRLFLEKAAEVEKPTPQLLEMIETARKLIQP